MAKPKINNDLMDDLEEAAGRAAGWPSCKAAMKIGECLAWGYGEFEEMPYELAIQQAREIGKRYRGK